MKRKLVNITLYILLLLPEYVLGQVGTETVKVGQKVPNFEFTNMFNYSEGAAKLDDFKGKLLIIDVWNRWCTGCIAGFPKMQKLQEKFNGKIQVILLTDDPVGEFKKIREKSPIVRSTKLPFSVENSIINKLFPHRGVPLHIWIDTSGIVLAVTNDYNTTENSIESYFKGKLPKMNKRDSEIIDFQRDKSLLLEGNGRQLLHLETYSFLMKSLKDYRFTVISFPIDSISKKRTGLKFINKDLPSLIAFAYNNPRIIFEDGERYFPPIIKDSMNQFVLDYQFCYELKVPKKFYDSSRLFKIYMQEDLSRFFNLNISMETREMLCYNLIQVGDLSKIISKDRSDNSINELNLPLWEIKNSSINSLIQGMSTMINSSSRVNKISVYNATGYSGKINLKLNLNDISMDSINRALKIHNLKFVPGYEKIEVILVKQGRKMF